MSDDKVYIIPIYVGSISIHIEELSVQATKQTTSQEIVTCLVNRLSLSQGTNYCLAEVINDSNGQECKERQLNSFENPVQVMLLWPKNSLKSQENCYKFCLREKMTNSDLMWTENFAMDPQLIKDYFNRFLYQPKDREYPDLCQLPDLNEKTLLENLRARFLAGHIYTYVGSILIALNPFKFYPIYNPKYVKLYQNRRLGPNLPPHIFAVADNAYHSMLKDQKNQCVVISGESGSGKTESTNFLLHHLTALSQKGSHGSGVEQTILSAGPVLEAFGNAKTAHNNNSSRFGKFIQVNYKENGMVHGAVVQKYLLEKSRICTQGRNERNYHVFYYLLAGASEAEAKVLHLKPLNEYRYLNQTTGSYSLESIDEKYEFSRLKQSMEMVGFTIETQRRLFSVLSAVLLLGNVQFQPRKLAYHHDEAVSVKNPEIVTLISDLLLVKQETLLAALTSKRARASGETLVINYRLPEAIASRDAMAKCLYGALFDWIVLQVNHALLSKKDTYFEHQGYSIGVLDIFGFEDFGTCNSFEQLCINYANEHLQYYFNQHVFKYEQEEYRKEGIRWTNIDFMDNTGCLQLIEGKPNGLLCILDDQCNFPGATNETLLQKFNSVHKSNQFYETPQKREGAFIVLHYAGKVKYQVHEMREKNLDLMRQDIVSVLKNSSMAFVRELVGADPVAVFRWAIVRAFFRSYFALNAAGRRHRQNRSDKNKFVTSSFQNRYIPINNNNKQRLPPRRQIMSSSLLTGNGTGYPLSNLRQCDYFSSKNRSLDSSSDYYYRTREPFYTSTISNSVLERMLCPNEARVLQKANQIVMKNKSFRPKEKINRSLKNLQSVKTLAGRTGIQSSAQLNKARKQPLTVTAQFQNSLQLLMDTLNQANPFFIRCIKSNGNKIANRFDDDTVQRQLRYTGMLETVRIRQAGFNVRLTYDEFIQLYRILLPKGLLSSQNDVKCFLLTLNLNKDNYQLGISKIFFRESEKIKLDCKLHQQIMASIIAIQRWFRACLERRRFLRLRNAVILIQSYWRMSNAQRTLMILRNRLVAATQIQAYWRAYKTKKWFNKFKASLIEFQAFIRGFNIRKKLHLIKEQNKHKKDVAHSDEAFISKESSQEELIHDRHSFHDNSNDNTLLHISNESGIQVDLDLDIKAKKPKDLNLRPTFSLPSVVLLSAPNMVFNCNSKNDKLEGLLSEGAILDSISLRKSKLNKMHKSIDSAENELFANFSLERKPNEESLTTSFNEVQTRQLTHDNNNVMRTNNDDSKISNNLLKTNYKTTLESSISLPEVPIRAIRRTRRDMSRRSIGEDIPDATIPVNFLETKNAILLGTINETHLNSSTILKCDQNFNWELRENLHDKHINKSPHDLSKFKNIELKRRNSDPSTTSCLAKANHEPLIKSNQTRPIHPVSNSYELEWQSPNSFTIAGHRFRKITRFSKDDRCIYCNDEMDAFVTQGHKCVECKQLFHTKCIQNRGVLQMPCPAQNNQENNTFHNFENSLTKTRRKYRKHTRTPYDFNKSIQHQSSNTYNQQQQQQQSHYQQNASNFSLTGMPREFTDRTDKIISDAHELQLMQDFITKKIYKMESEEGQKPSEVDRVFKQALREFKDNLVATYSVVNKNGFESLNIKYKDLIASFYNVMETVSRQRHKDTDFPVTMGVNAFRGFMNEFMTTRSDFDKPSKNKRKKEKKRRKADDTISFAGHSFQLTIINIPTACEICNSFFMWPLERSLVCQSCKLTCHKKCYIKVQSECGKDSNNQSSTYSKFKVFGIPLHLLLTNECKIPVVIDRLITTIEMYGLYTEGIYRKSGVSSKVKELKQKMEECSQDSVNFENYQVHVLAAVLKSFLREMPEPLLTFDCYEDFIRAARLADSQERISTLFAILRKLPKPNYDLMERLIFHLARVALHENVNRMNSNSLAIVFAPCILRTNTVLPAQDSLSDISRQTQSIEIIIIEQLKKLKSTLADIETLDTACHTATYRLSSLRCSKIFSTDDHPSITSNISTENEKNNKNEPETQSKTSKNQGDEEEALLEGHIYEIKKEKAHLTSTLPTLTRSNSDEDILSTDLDGEGSVDDMSSYVIQSSSDLNDTSHVISKRAPLARTVSGHIDIRANANEKHKLLRRQLSNESTKLHSKAVPECDDTPIIV